MNINLTDKNLYDVSSFICYAMAVSTDKKVSNYSQPYSQDNFNSGFRYAVDNFETINNWTIDANINCDTLLGIGYGLKTIYERHYDFSDITKESFRKLGKKHADDDNDTSPYFYIDSYWESWVHTVLDYLSSTVVHNDFIDKINQTQLEELAFTDGYLDKKIMSNTNRAYLEFYFSGVRQRFYKLNYLTNCLTISNSVGKTSD